MPRVYKNPNGYVVDLPEFKVRQRERIPVSVMERGACKTVDDPGMFFPEVGQSSKPAKKVCASCPVQLSCLHYSVREREPAGIWGGASERTRLQRFVPAYTREGKLPWVCAVCRKPYVRVDTEPTCSEVCGNKWAHQPTRLKLKLRRLSEAS